MTKAKISFSGDFGGLDAQERILPHFKALKSAAKNLFLLNFPYDELGFLLRVDGKVKSYGFSGLAYPEVGKFKDKRTYLSYDIGLSFEDQKDIPASICEALLASPAKVKEFLKNKGIEEIDQDQIQEVLRTLCENYKSAVL